MLIIGMILFLAIMLISAVFEINIIFGLVGGIIIFSAIGICRELDIKEITKSFYYGAKESKSVVIVVFLIGALMASWRSSGIIAYIIEIVSCMGTENLPLIAFIVSAIVGFFIGSSFGVVGTIGTVFMIIAETLGGNSLVIAGAIMSGAYFGERTSPISSAVYLISECTMTKHMDNVKRLIISGIVPLVLSLGFYLILGKIFTETGKYIVLDNLSAGYNIAVWLGIPIILLVVLPWVKISVFSTLIVSIFAAGVAAVVLQDISISMYIKYLITGYEIHLPEIDSLYEGGGIISMLEANVVVIFSSGFAGILQYIGVLDEIKKAIGRIKTDRCIYINMMLSVLGNMIFCNPTITTLMQSKLMTDFYKNNNSSSEELALDIGNSTTTLCGIVPWNVSCSIPFAMLGVPISGIIFSVFLWMNPICAIVLRNRNRKLCI